MNKVILFFLTFLLCGCNQKDKHSEKKSLPIFKDSINLKMSDIKDSLKKNKNKILFLDCYYGMSENLYFVTIRNLILESRINKDSSYNFYLNSNEDYVNFKMTPRFVKGELNSIKLISTFENISWLSYNDAKVVTDTKNKNFDKNVYQKSVYNKNKTQLITKNYSRFKKKKTDELKKVLNEKYLHVSPQKSPLYLSSDNSILEAEYEKNDKFIVLRSSDIYIDNHVNPQFSIGIYNKENYLNITKKTTETKQIQNRIETEKKNDNYKKTINDI